MANLKAHIRHFLGPAQKCWFWSSQYVFFGISWPSAWPENAHFEIPKTHFGNFLGPWSEILKIEVKCMFFRVFPLGCGFLACQTRFSKHVDNGPFHWSCSLAVFTVSVAFVCFLFLTMNLSWVIFAVFNDLAWKCCLCMRFSIQAHCQHRGLGSSVFWHFRIFPNVFDGLSMLTMFSLYLHVLFHWTRFAKGSSLCSCILKSPECGSEWTQIRYVMFFVCSVSWFLRAFNARAHASIYIYIYIYMCVCV